MSQAGGAGPASVICNRLAENRRIDQCFSPHGKSDDGPVVEDLDQLRMRGLRITQRFAWRRRSGPYVQETGLEHLASRPESERKDTADAHCSRCGNAQQHPPGHADAFGLSP